MRAYFLAFTWAIGLSCDLASAVEYCGSGYYCPVSSTYCCGIFLCCTYVWALWYFWVGIVLGLIAIGSVVYICIRTKNQQQMRSNPVHVATVTTAVPYNVPGQQLGPVVTSPTLMHIDGSKSAPMAFTTSPN
ncbi:uncharacterized protein LOC143464717 [Clavelina lepadiformis]|uniref:Uncharacterized protein n=1 Tax=Clavelina lepadiformis TaxID=159417 RepID=A0ABP0EVL6_CLALP